MKNSKNNRDLQATNETPNSIESFLHKESEFLFQSMESEEVFKNLTRLEESLIATINESSHSILKSGKNQSIRKFQEDLDVIKAEKELQPSRMREVPDFLKRYTELNLEKPERKSSLVVRLSQAGIQVFNSLKEGLNLNPSMVLSPELRSAAAAAPTTSNDAGFVVFEEKIQNGQKFLYQMVRETPKEVFLSIKMESQQEYRQVILRRDGRFMLSSKVNSEGIVNFSGLLEGAYSVEFMGGNQNKIIDLYLILD
ncbi:MAG: hypothetical protein JJT78_17915 [Leptospira sp.]|nr:hypothetical protein [Leptospira sp.]